MNVWSIIVAVLVLAFAVKVAIKLGHRKRNTSHHPDISTKKRLKKFVNRFRHLEGIGD